MKGWRGYAPPKVGTQLIRAKTVNEAKIQNGFILFSKDSFFWLNFPKWSIISAKQSQKRGNFGTHGRKSETKHQDIPPFGGICQTL